MAVLLFLLIVAFIPTGHFYFTQSASLRHDPIDLGGTDASLTFDDGEGVMWAFEDVEVDLRYVLPSSPAVCFFKSGMSIGRNQQAYISLIVSLILLSHGYLMRLGKLFETSSSILSHLLRGSIEQGHCSLIRMWENKLQRMGPETALKLCVVFLPLQATLYYTILAFMDIYSSMAAEVSSYR